MKRFALTLAVLGLAATATTANAWAYSYTCSDGFSWVGMVYAQPVGSACNVLMPGGWIYYGYTI